MNIIVCLKPLRHIFARTGFDPGENYLVTEDAICRVNPCDEAALGLAIKAKEICAFSQVTVVTLGPLFAEKELRRSLALGVDRFVQIETSLASNSLEPRQKSGLLARAVRELGADLVLCGKESIDRRNGQVGAFLAHFLERPFISGILQLALTKDNKQAMVTRKAVGGKREVYMFDLPAVVSVDLNPNQLLFPTIQHKSRVDHLPIQKLNYADQVIQRQTKTGRIFSPNPRSKRVKIPKSDLPAYQRIRELLEASHIERKGTLLTGSVESQVDAIVSFLQEHGLLGP